MQTIDLNVQPRSTNGKGASRRSRAAGIVPGVVYGAGIPTPKSVSIPPDQLKKVAGAVGHNVFITLKAPGSRRSTARWS